MPRGDTRRPKAAALIVTLTLGLLAAPLAAEAQPAGKKVPRVAIVLTTTSVAEIIGPNPINPPVRGFVHGLRDLGWVDGQTIIILRRSAEGKCDRASAIFAELARVYRVTGEESRYLNGIRSLASWGCMTYGE